MTRTSTRALGLNSPVLIVGAGPVGLTLAWCLAESGMSVRVFESAPEITNQLRASTFHPPTLDMFQASGITDELIANGRITPTWQIRMHATGEKAEFDLAVLHRDTQHPYRLQCHQSQLSLSLFKRLAPGTVEFSSEVVEVGQNNDSVWLRTKYSEHPVTGSLLIGCDGARSLVRRSIGAEFEGGTYPDNTILVTTQFPFEQYLPQLSGVNYIWKNEGTYSLLRLPDVWRISLHPSAGQSPEEALLDDSILAQTREIIPDAPDLEILEKRIYRVHHRVASLYRKGLMVLAGDAAHLNSPKGGMGLNGGIHDAFCLADVITQIKNGASVSLLDKYARQRQPIARDEIIAQADTNRKRMNTTDPTARSAHLQAMQCIAADQHKSREFLLKSSMISGLQRAAAIS